MCFLFSGVSVFFIIVVVFVLKVKNVIIVDIILKKDK